MIKTQKKEIKCLIDCIKVIIKYVLTNLKNALVNSLDTSKLQSCQGQLRFQLSNYKSFYSHRFLYNLSLFFFD